MLEKREAQKIEFQLNFLVFLHSEIVYIQAKHMRHITGIISFIFPSKCALFHNFTRKSSLKGVFMRWWSDDASFVDCSPFI